MRPPVDKWPPALAAVARVAAVVVAIVAPVLAGPGCGSGADPRPVPGSLLLPASYPESFVEVRACAQSVDHDLAYVVVKATATTAAIYRDGPFPFPAGSVISKEQFVDPACTNLTGITIMRKEPAGYDPAGGDWRWQTLDAQRRIAATGDVRRCASCHAGTACRDRDFTCGDRQ